MITKRQRKNPYQELKKYNYTLRSVYILIITSLFFIFPLFGKTRVVEFQEIHTSGAQAITDASTFQMEILNKNQLHAYLLTTLGPVEFEDSLERPALATPYALPESSILQFNEIKVLAGYIKIIRYYIDNARTILKLNKDQQPKILIRIARANSSFALFDLIQKCLAELYGENYKIYVDHRNAFYRGVYITGKNVYLHYRASTDVFPKFMENFDIVLTIGGAHSLSPSLLPGTFLVSEKHTSLRMNERIIDLKHLTSLHNDLKNRLPKILANTQDVEMLDDYLNKHSPSPNTLKKNQRVESLELKDFQSPLILVTPDKIVQNEGDALFRIMEK